MEALETLYRKNTFTFSSIALVISHLLNIPPQRIPVMKDVKWRWVLYPLIFLGDFLMGIVGCLLVLMSGILRCLGWSVGGRKG
jgi:hypothetical protein